MVKSWVGGVKIEVLTSSKGVHLGGSKTPKMVILPLSKAFFHYPKVKKRMASAALATTSVTKRSNLTILAIFDHFRGFGQNPQI